MALKWLMKIAKNADKVLNLNKENIDLNGGTMTFANKGVINNAPNTFTQVDTNNIFIDTDIPTISAVLPPNPGKYVLGETLQFFANFDKTVLVTGTPRIELDIDGNTKYATYVGGNNSSTLIFQYQVDASDLDLDGISASSPIDLNSGTIKDDFGNDAILTYSPVPMPTTFVDGDTPYVVSVTPSANNTYLAGDMLQLSVNVSEPVTVTGTPRIQVNIGPDSRYLEYVSGSGSDTLLFEYSVTLGESDTDGVAYGNFIDFNGGNIEDASTNLIEQTFVSPLTPSVLVDAKEPEVLSITPPADSTYYLGQSMFFILNFDRAVNIQGSPRLPIFINSDAPSPIYAQYLSGTGTEAIVFQYTVQNNKSDPDGITIANYFELNGGTIRGGNNLDASLDLTTPVGAINTSAVLIDAVLPEITALTVPVDNSYVTTNNLDFVITFNKNVDVLNSPRLELNIGGATRYADYILGTGTNILTFRYTIVGGDIDGDGILFSNNSIDLNTTGTIRDAQGNNATLNFSAFIPDMTNIFVNSTPPTISSITPPADNTYLYNTDIDFIVNTSENVNVTGSPRIAIDIGGTTKYASYQSGTGTSTLTFRYTVEAGLADADGIVISSPIDLNSGTIQNAGLQDLDLTFTPPAMPAVLVNSNVPTITSITPPADATYTETQNLDFIVNTSENINVTGTPRLQVDIGGTIKYADYLSGTGTSALTFRYTVEDALSDDNGIALTSPLELNGGTLQNAGLDNMDLNFTPPTMSAVLVDSLDPTVAILVPADSGYINSSTDSATFTVSGTCSEAGQTVTITVDSGAATNPVGFICDGTNFTGTLDTTGLSEAAHTFDASIQDTSLNTGNSTTNNVTKDVTAPILSGVTPPADGNFTTPNNIDFVVAYNENITISNTPRIVLDIGGVTNYADYNSGTGSTSLTFRYIVSGGDYDANGIGISNNSIDLNSTGVVTDEAGNTAPLDMTAFIPNLSNVFVNVTPVTITSITPPADATYTETQNIDFIVNTSELVNVTGTPRITIDIGGTTKYADYFSGTGSSALTFRYTVEGNLLDTDGIAISSPLDINGGTIQYATSFDLDLTFTPPSMGAVLVDSMRPTITSITPPADATYVETNNIDFIVNTDENINVTGTPRIQIDIGGTTKFANYVSGTGTSALTFRYSVEASLSDGDGITISSPIQLNGGTMQNAGPFDLDLSFTPPAMPAVLVDSNVPTITSITPPADATYTDTQNLDFVVNVSESVNVTGTPRIQIDIGGTTKYATYLSGTGSNALTFRYTVEVGLSDGDGITISSPLDLNSGTIQNAGLENMDLTFAPPGMPGVLVDSAPPTITSVTPPADATYTDAQNVDFVVNTSENVNVTGTPRIQIDVGGVTKYADYLSGTGSSSLTFRYVVETGLEDTNGITVASPMDLNSGTIQNVGLQNLDLSFTPPIMTNVLVDSIVPTISSVTPPADATYVETDNLDFVVNISENVDVTGTPRIQIDIGGTTKYADYLSGTGTNALTFRYTVEANLTDTNGITISSPLDLNSGTIQNAGLENLILTYTPPVMTNVLVDSADPTVAITNPTEGSYINVANDSGTFTISGTCSEASQTVTIEVDAGAATSPVGFLCNGTNFTGTIDTTGFSEGAHTIQAFIQDAAANQGTSTVINVTKDTLVPTVSSVNVPIPNNYIVGNNLDFTVNMDEATNVTGTPRLSIDIGGVTKYATYQSGTGTTALLFRYTIINGDSDTNGLGYVSTNIDLNGGTLLDTASNAANLDLEATVGLPSLASINVYGVLPNVAITSAPDITAANENAYTVTGTCDQEGRSVTVNIDGLVFSPTCSSGTWTTGGVNVSSRLDNAALPITADLDDAAGNNATQATTTVNKDTANPTVAITFSPDITSANDTNYAVSGTCTDVGQIVDVNLDDTVNPVINVQPNCSGGTWTTGSLDVSSLNDGTINVTADHLTATQASTTVNKDTTSSIVVISSAPNINGVNQTTYIVSGTCSTNGVVVNVIIGTIPVNPNCNNGSWSTGIQDVSGLAEGPIVVTADHDGAPQAVANITKNTSTPTIASHSIPTTLKDSMDLNWTLNDPGGFTINDYQVQYRVKGSGTWLAFSDGVSTNTFATVTGLTASTTYETRVRVQYDTSNFSAWSVVAEGLTKPDDPLFNSPHLVMNVGGATSTKVVAMYANTEVFHNGVSIGTIATAGGTLVVPGGTARFDTIDADKPIYTAGNLGGTNNGAGAANIVWQPTAWAGTSFSFNAIRSNPQSLHVYAVENATVTVRQGSTILAGPTTITAGSGATLQWSVFGSYQVSATGLVLAYHVSRSTQTEDPKPLLPSSFELIGFPSNSMRLTTDVDATNYNGIHSDSATVAGNLNKPDSINIGPSGGGSSLYQGNSLLISADQKVAGASFADSNGNCAAPFLPTNMMKKRYMVNVSSNWVAFASKQAGTIDVYSPGQTIGVSTPVQTLTLTRTGTNPNAPYRVRRGVTPEGYRFVSTVPMAGWYQPDTANQAGNRDETILVGTDDES